MLTAVISGSCLVPAAANEEVNLVSFYPAFQRLRQPEIPKSWISRTVIQRNTHCDM